MRIVAKRKFIYQQNQRLPKLGLRRRGKMFCCNWYQKEDWLDSIEGKKGLLSWPYFLFKFRLSATWTVTGYKNMQGLLSDCKKKEVAKSHIGVNKT